MLKRTAGSLLTLGRQRLFLHLPSTRLLIITLLILTGFSAEPTLGAGRRGSEHSRAPVALIDVNVVPMDRERVINGQTVILRDGRIAEIGPQNAVKVPRDAIRIEGRGRYLMPGLADMHVHLFSPDDFVSYLAFGVTTILDMSGSPAQLRWRREIARGHLLGPTLYTAGTTLDGNPPLNPMFWTVETPAQARLAVRRQKRDGYDLVKIYGTLNPDVYQAIQDEARRQGLTLVGHIPRQPDFQDIINGNQSMIAHGEELLATYFQDEPDETKIPELMKLLKMSGKTVTPNLTVIPRMIKEVEDLKASLSEDEIKYLSRAAYTEWMPANNRNAGQEDAKGYVEYLGKRRAFLAVLTKALNEAGVPLLAGTDSAVVGYPGSSLQLELKELVQAGLTPFEALQTATRNAGDFIKRSANGAEKFGVIEVGGRADLILLDENPLTDINYVDGLRGVAVRGRWLTKEELDRKREQLAADNVAVKSMVDQFDELVEGGNVAEAASILRALRQKFPGREFVAEWVLMIKGQRLQEKNAEQSLAVRRMNAELYPDSFSAYNELAAAYFQERKTALALKALDRSLALAPANALAVNLREKVLAANRPLSFDPVGTYEVVKLKKNPGAEAETARLIISRRANRFDVRIVSGESQENRATQFLAGGNKMWAVFNSNYGPLEFRVEVNGPTFSGDWVGMFGNNGKLRVTKTAPAP